MVDLQIPGRTDGLEQVQYSRRDLSYNDTRYRTGRSLLPYRSLREEKRALSPSKSRSPSSSLLKQAYNGSYANERGLQTLKSEHGDTMSPSLDRRTRRFKQAIREPEQSQRQRSGRKPFYLTLDADRIPYGPGKIE